MKVLPPGGRSSKMMLLCIILLLSFFCSVIADSDADFTSYVTVRMRSADPTRLITDKSQLPNVRALKLNVAYYGREAISPGYWFVAPYGVIDPEPPTKQWKPCQVGPYIYDADGVCSFFAGAERRMELDMYRERQRLTEL